MQITFNGTIIAQEGDFGGMDGIEGFIPKGKGTTQWQQFLRATDAIPIARGNRKRTLTGKIIPPATGNLALAMLLRSTAYNNLPDSGVLLIQVGGETVTFANAVLDTHETLEDLEGVSYGFQLTFSVGPGVGSGSTAPINPVSGGTVLTDDSGRIITDDTGVSLSPN